MKSIFERGLTLIELIVVIVIVGILAAALLAVINPAKRVNQANDAKVKADINRIVSSLEAYSAKKRVYPLTANLGNALVPNELKALPKPPGGSGNYSDNYVSTNGSAARLYWELKATSNFFCWKSKTTNTYPAGISEVATAAECPE